MRIALGIEYDGSQYHGWQLQKHQPKTVQQDLEVALSKVANHPVRVTCAGRTDTGVHGTNQVVHFDTDAVRSEKGWVFGCNTNLPDAIAVTWAKPVADDFHARFSAEWRAYRYLIFNHPSRPALMAKHVTWQYLPLDVQRMQQASRCLIGEHDFSSYRAVDCQAEHAVRRIHSVEFTRVGPMIVMDICANAFLMHMVRNIVGVMSAIGSGKQPVDWAQRVLEHRDRTKGGVTAPPNGLYFVAVGYPEQFAIPNPSPRIPVWPAAEPQLPFQWRALDNSQQV